MKMLQEAARLALSLFSYILAVLQLGSYEWTFWESEDYILWHSCKIWQSMHKVVSRQSNKQPIQGGSPKH